MYADLTWQLAADRRQRLEHAVRIRDGRTSPRRTRSKESLLPDWCPPPLTQ